MEVYESVGKSVIFVCKEAQRADDALNDCGKSKKCCGVFLLIYNLKTVHLRQLKKMKSFQL